MPHYTVARLLACLLTNSLAEQLGFRRLRMRQRRILNQADNALLRKCHHVYEFLARIRRFDIFQPFIYDFSDFLTEIPCSVTENADIYTSWM